MSDANNEPSHDTAAGAGNVVLHPGINPHGESAARAARAATLLDKWRLVGVGVSDARLSRVAVACLWHVTEKFNAQKGYAYPSYAGLAKLCAAHRTSVIRAFEQLDEFWYLAVIQRGMRNEANRYRPNFLLVASALPGVGASTLPASSADATDLVALARLESSYQTPEGSEEEDHAAPSPSAPLAAPVVAAADRAQRDREFDQFWRSYPKKKERPDALREFRRILDAGEVSASDVIAGATRYAAWQAATQKEDIWISLGANWLKGRKWEKPYDLPAPRKPAAAAHSPASHRRKRGAVPTVDREPIQQQTKKTSKLFPKNKRDRASFGAVVLRERERAGLSRQQLTEACFGKGSGYELELFANTIREIETMPTSAIYRPWIDVIARALPGVDWPILESDAGATG